MVKSVSIKATAGCCLLARANSFSLAGKCASAAAKTRTDSFRSMQIFRPRRSASIRGTNHLDNSIESSMPPPSDPSFTAHSSPNDFVTIIGKTASSFVSVSFFLLLASRRDALMVTLFIGSILNAVCSKVLKKLLNHERPATLQTNENVKLKPSDGGMPSSHAMSLGFIATVITGAIVPTYLAGFAMAAYSVLALRYRIRVHLHSFEQVVVGLVMGVGNGLLWLKYGLGLGDSNNGPVITWVKENCVSAETGLIPLAALTIPILVGVLVVGSFERRVTLWVKQNKVNSTVSRPERY
ncbi:hypothetical protein HJC23_005607 [Cyclotella cryptica]|uniref:Phosphatidic acid phosphatase type 2/haloperoxidase domain-containing protein n=1 Tax=Cyclotella cryptica TaxID=29204 RepID=A0ABD3PYE3_9STRA|eukprot:CCRYP_010474-RA/>CCRYP_010474-RA protein AED:0.03 eAED:0.03 QI:162/1/1/1/0.5/0.33/3/509/295